ncbi:hypothetical protein ACQ5ES_07555 [Pseudidiomarina sp. E22-M8]|uniref:hypothetical protein n=1 Tax=Pseudidiomarina sp. E22-M8 TaxID=3424768 RepID=UPI00403C50FF
MAIRVPFNNDAFSVLQEVQGENTHYYFVYQGKPVARNVDGATGTNAESKKPRYC